MFGHMRAIGRVFTLVALVCEAEAVLPTWATYQGTLKNTCSTPGSCAHARLVGDRPALLTPLCSAPARSPCIVAWCGSCSDPPLSVCVLLTARAQASSPM